MKFTLYNPLKGAILKYHNEGGNVTQWYGENPALYEKNVPNYPKGMGHNGIDIAMPWGTPVLAAHDGIILGIAEGVNASTLGGNFVMLHSYDFLNDENNKTCKAITGYFHLSKVTCSLGQKVKIGDIIGLEGNTGFVVSTATPYWDGINPTAGSHLHFTLSFTEKIGSNNYKPILNSFGKATIDPAPYLGLQSREEKIISIQRQLIGLYTKLISLLKGRRI